MEPFDRDYNRAPMPSWAKRISILVASILLNACETVPTHEFNAYRDTFDQARKAGEQVLMDYAAAKVEAEAAEIITPEPVLVSRGGTFDAAAIAAQSSPIDDVAIRLRAWEVLAAYNEVLLALIEGRPAAQVESATRGLVDSLTAFPAKAVQDLAGEITPVLGVLTTLLTEYQIAFDRKKALDAMVEVGPQISERFIQLLLKDGDLFYSVRFGLNDRQFRQTVEQIIRLRKAFKKLAGTAAHTGPVTAMVDAINTRLAELPPRDDGRPQVSPLVLDQSGNVRDPTTLSQLADLRDSISAQVDQALAQTRELNAHREMLTAYIRMLAELDIRLNALVQAARTAQAAPVNTRDLLYSIIRVRQSYLVYRENRL